MQPILMKVISNKPQSIDPLHSKKTFASRSFVNRAKQIEGAQSLSGTGLDHDPSGDAFTLITSKHE